MVQSDVGVETRGQAEGERETRPSDCEEGGDVTERVTVEVD